MDQTEEPTIVNELEQVHITTPESEGNNKVKRIPIITQEEELTNEVNDQEIESQYPTRLLQHSNHKPQISQGTMLFGNAIIDNKIG